jgi:formamidopyrimidine-DNA glycosylase
MPELPDVEIQRSYLSVTSLHRAIDRVRVYDGQVLDRVTASSLGRMVHRRSWTSAKRHGKWMIALMGEDGGVVFHFGMTGRLNAHRAASEPAEHTQVRFCFKDRGSLDYIAPRKLGAVGFADSIGAVVEREALGPDALAIPYEAFEERIGARRGTIKGALTDQTVLAGLGNIYADDVLFHARIHPRSPCSRLSVRRLHALHEAMIEVLRTAIDAGADPDALPGDYLLPVREAGATCPRCSGTVSTYKLGGRRGYYCPSCQQW